MNRDMTSPSILSSVPQNLLGAFHAQVGDNGMRTTP
jgi:hypothetical protein